MGKRLLILILLLIISSWYLGINKKEHFNKDETIEVYNKYYSRTFHKIDKEYFDNKTIIDSIVYYKHIHFITERTFIPFVFNTKATDTILKYKTITLQ